jgi:hypothetical protein
MGAVAIPVIHLPAEQVTNPVSVHWPAGMRLLFRLCMKHHVRPPLCVWNTATRVLQKQLWLTNALYTVVLWWLCSFSHDRQFS